MSDPTKRRLLELDARGKPTFTYRKAAETNIAATFARIRREQKQVKPVNVQPMRKRA